MSIADLRKDYSHAILTEAEVDPDPVVQFAAWFQQAMQAGIPEANAMSVATVGADGRPSSRILLIKDFNQQGFTWFTNYASRKGRDLEAHPHAALLFHWVELERQVRIEGRVERLPEAQSDAYFHSRPLKSRLGALASAQSEPIADRSMLEQRFRQAEAEHGDQPVRPPHWGGYRLIPDRMEFWQGRPSRLHDRIVYTRPGEGAWRRERLQP